MKIFLSILLLVLASLSTLCAFGGRTWNEGSGPVLKRITLRGWLALVCLVLTLAVGTFKELLSNSEEKRKEAVAANIATQEKLSAETRQAELKSQLKDAQVTITKLELANVNLQLAELKKTQDQITGGKGFPIAMIMPFNPDSDGSFPLWVMVSGEAPLSDVSFKVIEGAYKAPTPEEFARIQADEKALLTGHRGDDMTPLGVLAAHKLVPLAASRIHPSRDTVNTYRIFFTARNGSVLQIMDVRFNPSENIWQSRYEVRSQDPNTPNKLLGKQSWEPQKFSPPLYGVGPPHNSKGR
jgi:hypothetical protein